MRSRLDVNPKREAISRSVNLLRELFHVINPMLTKYFHSLSRMISVRFLELISTHSCVRMQENMVLNHLSMKSGLRQSCKSSSHMIVHSDSMLRVNSGLRCV